MTPPEYSITGQPIRDAGDGIWDEGEWISWDYINQQLAESGPEGGLCEDMIVVVKTFLEETGRHLPIYGELGEQYAARRFGIELHEDSKAQGSDGRLGEALVEIKTILLSATQGTSKSKRPGILDFLQS